MKKGLEFICDAARETIEQRNINYGVTKAIDILFELNIEEEKIKYILVKHFDLKYSEVEFVIKQAKEVKGLK